MTNYPYKTGLIYDSSIGTYGADASVSPIQGISEQISPNSIPSGLEFGAATFVVSNQIHPDSIASDSNVPSPQVGLTFMVGSVASSSEVSSPHVYQMIKPSGIPTKEIFGSSHLYQLSSVDSILNSSIVSPIKNAFNLVNINAIPSRSVVDPIYSVLHFIAPDTIEYESDIPLPQLGLILQPDSIMAPLRGVNYPIVFFAQAGSSNTNLSPIIAAFDQQLYDRLSAKEQYCYNTAEGIDVYGTKFQSLSSAIVSWLAQDRTALMKKLMNPMYSYLTFNAMYQMNRNLKSAVDAYKLFSMNGFVAKAVSAPDDYYADYNGSTTPNLDADTQTINDSFPIDEQNVNDMINDLTDTIGDKVNDLMFVDEEILGGLSKDELAVLIFNSLHYKNLYIAGNIQLALPPNIN